jgi:hypothetical protein
MACYGNSFTVLYVDDVHTSQETCLWASTAFYGDSFDFLYVDDVRTSQETHLWTSTACYGDSFTFLYVDYVRIRNTVSGMSNGAVRIILRAFRRNIIHPSAGSKS